MLSIETEAKLAEIFLRICQQEKEVEECRFLLSKSMDFDPLTVFQALDRLSLGSLSSSEIQNVLDRFHFFCSNDEAYLVVRQYDSNLDGRLSIEEFNQFVLPSTNPGLREISLSRRGSYTPEVEFLLLKLLQTEVLFHRNLEAVRREIILKPDFNLLEAFRTLDCKNASFIDRNSLLAFLRKHRQVYEEDIDAVLRRVDNDGDELISYLEFVDCVMPSRTAVTKERADNSKGYRQASSPLRNTSGSQFSFRNSSPLRSPRKELVEAPMSQSMSYLRSSGISSPKRSSPLRKSSPLRGSPLRSSPLKSSPLRNSSIRNSDLSSASIRVEQRDYYNNPVTSSLTHTYSSPLKNSGNRTSPLRSSNLNISQRSPPKNVYETGDFNKTTEFRSSYNRASSPLRRTSPEKSFVSEARSSYTSGYRSAPAPTPSQSLEEKEIVSGFQEEIKISREIESSKNVLALKHDFNLIDAFRMFDLHDIGMININDIESTLNSLSFKITRDEIYLLVKHYSRLQDGRLRFSDFSEIFTPRQEEYSRILRNRSGINVVGVDRMKVFTRDTLNVFLDVFRMIFEAEGVAERIRQRLTRMPGFNLYSAFNSLDRDRNGFITMNEFQQVLQSQGIFVNPKDLQVLMHKYDKNKDGRVSYSEFIEEVTPKSPQRY